MTNSKFLSSSLIKSPTLLKIAATCSFLGASTTAYLMLMPSPTASTELEQAMLSSNNIYLSKLWVLFFHPQFNLISTVGCSLLLWRKATWQILLAIFFLASWSYTELSQQALLIDGLNQYWRPGFINASSLSEKSAFGTILQFVSGFSDSQYFVVIYSFGMGSIFLGWAFLKSDQLGQIIGIALILIGILSVMSFGSYYLQMTFFSPAIELWYGYIYPYLQPAVRLATGWWILIFYQKNSDIKSIFAQ